MSTTPARSFALFRTIGLLALWALTAALMVHDNARDPYDALLTGTARYGHNHQGALRDGLLMSLVELSILLALLQPWRTEAAGRRWGGAVALALLLPWTMYSAMASMHAGGIVMIHLMWLFAVVLILMIGLPVSFFLKRLRARRTDSGAATRS